MRHLLQYALGLVLAVNTTVARKLVLRELVIPPQVDIRDDVTLSCRFDLAGDHLYSVKWYKDEFEFYRYMPGNIPPCQPLPVPWVTVLNDTNCNMEDVTLTRLTFNSSGAYRCEVSTEGPNFQTDFKNSNMTVMALPLEEPTIEGVLSSYSVGDSVRATCTSAKSSPPSQLAWFINGVKAERWILDQTPTTKENSNNDNPLSADHWLLEQTPPPSHVDAQGLYTSSLSLNFVTEKRFFQGSEGEMELRCTATVGNRTWSTVVTPTLTTLTNLKLAQESLRNSGQSSTTSHNTLVLSLLCLARRLISS